VTPAYYDVAVIGAGAAGMMCAAVAGQRGRRVVLIDHANKLAEKIRISGGGRCNFTNLGAGPENFLSDNPHYCRSALAHYTPQDFLALLKRHRVSWHEKHRGQLFCDASSQAIIDVLRRECDAGGVAWRMGCAIAAIARHGDGFSLCTAQGPLHARRVVIATGGMALPQLGASDFGLTIARQFGLKIIEPRPALVPLHFDHSHWAPFATLAGVALEAEVATGQPHADKHRDKHGDTRAVKRGGTFVEDLLFTHRGLSGPAILQISSYWQPGSALHINLAPGRDMAAELIAAKPGARQHVGNALAQSWPRRLSESWLAALEPALHPGLAALRLADAPDRALRALGAAIHRWTLTPSGTAGYKKAEVMRGGVDTRALNQKTMAARAVPGLHFIGEVVDVTGWLGGYNFQWAWASGVACGQAV